VYLGEEVVLVVGCEVGLSACLTAQRLTGTNQLQVVQAAGDATVAIGVEGIQVDAGATVHTGVDLGAGKHGVAVSIHDAGGSGRVGVDEVGTGISGVIGSLYIAIAQGVLNGCQRGYALAVALQLGLTLLVRSFDCRLNLGDRLGVGLGDDEADGVLGGTAVDGRRLPDIGIGLAGVGASDNLHRIVDLGWVVRHIKIPP